MYWILSRGSSRDLLLLYFPALYICICILLPMHFSYVHGARFLVIASCPLHHTRLTRGDMVVWMRKAEGEKENNKVIWVFCNPESSLRNAKCGRKKRKYKVIWVFHNPESVLRNAKGRMLKVESEKGKQKVTWSSEIRGPHCGSGIAERTFLVAERTC